MHQMWNAYCNCQWKCFHAGFTYIHGRMSNAMLHTICFVLKPTLILCIYHFPEFYFMPSGKCSNNICIQYTRGNEIASKYTFYQFIYHYQWFSNLLICLFGQIIPASREPSHQSSKCQTYADAHCITIISTQSCSLPISSTIYTCFEVSRFFHWLTDIFTTTW